MSTPNLYHPETFSTIISRINQLTPASKPLWGTMDAAKMLAHCAEVQEVANGTKELKGTPFIVKLLKGLVKKMVFDKNPYSPSMNTHPQYMVTNEKDFETEKTRLLSGLYYFIEHEDRQVNHPLFGINSSEEKGWAYYKHLDHHLRQFGV